MVTSTSQDFDNLIQHSSDFADFQIIIPQKIQEVIDQWTTGKDE